MDEETAISLHEGMQVFTSDDADLGRIKNVWTPAGATEGPAADRVVAPAAGEFPPPIDQPTPGGSGVAQGGTVVVSPEMATPERVKDTTSAVGIGDADPIVEAPTETYFQIDRRLAPDWYVPASAVASIRDDVVTLALTEDEAGDRDWGLKPDWLAE